MRGLAERQGDVFLPNPEPRGPVDYVLMCMEPSLGRWSRSPAEARARIESGFRNFLYSLEDFILHFCVRRYLCTGGERYHITDLSKGAMLVEAASSEREKRYDSWYPLLEEELKLVAREGAHFIAVGRPVAEYLVWKGFPKPLTRIIHYSGQAGRARKAGIVGREGSYESFRTMVSLAELLATARDVLEGAGVPAGMRDETLARLRNGELSESRCQLIFNYKIAFEEMREGSSRN